MNAGIRPLALNMLIMQTLLTRDSLVSRTKRPHLEVIFIKMYAHYPRLL